MTNAWVARDTPPLLINLDMEAPRVALPVPSDSEQNKETLVLDFGYFRLQSDLSSSEALPEDEALVYDCLALKGGNVQATLVEGDFTWQRWEACVSPICCFASLLPRPHALGD